MGGLNQVLLGPLTRRPFDAAALGTLGSERGSGGAALRPLHCRGASVIRRPRLCPQRKCTWLWAGQVERSRAGTPRRGKNKQAGVGGGGGVESRHFLRRRALPSSRTSSIMLPEATAGRFDLIGQWKILQVLNHPDDGDNSWIISHTEEDSCVTDTFKGFCIHA